jgi:thiosulfate dehydrogenase
MRHRPIAIAVVVLVAACNGDGDVEHRTGSAVEHGRALFDDPRSSPSPSNVFACSTCHASDADHVRPGNSLAGATMRTSFWGGQRVDLLEAINECRLSFMDAPRPWTKDDDDARAMFAYLASLPGTSDALPFDVEVRDPPPGGDPARGADVYARACDLCHGALRDGANRLVPFAPILPVTPAGDRAFYVRRVRRGAFASASGSMPPFSHEALSDDDLSALLAYLGF